MSATTSLVPPPPPSEGSNTDTGADLIAGWLGGAVGILVSNPLEVLKVRLQTSRSLPSPLSPTSNNRVGRTSPPGPPLSSPSPTSLSSLWKAEGIKFLFAGAAGPILGLAFIDSAFFGLYGVVMQQLAQDRQDPSSLSRVFVAGATAGGMCAMLETPIEVVKCRAQLDTGSTTKLGSFKIAQMIAKKEGVRGFYIGGLTTAVHDGISSGIFWWGYFVFRRLLRGDRPFEATTPWVPTPPPSTATAISDEPEKLPPGTLNRAEVGRMLLAGGLAGALSAVIPYPFDIIKTRLQTANFEARGHPSPSSSPCPTPTTTSTASKPLQPRPPPTIRSIATEIHSDGISSHRFRYPSTILYSFLSRHVYPPGGNGSTLFGRRRIKVQKMVDGRPGPDPRAEKVALRVLGLKGFARGLGPTTVSSFVGSAVTITTFELALHWLGGDSGGEMG